MAFGNLSTAIQAGISGRNLAQNSVATAAQNISNVNTEGYSRKELTYSTKVLGGIGVGVEAQDIRRITSDFKIEQVREMTSTLKKLEVLATYYKNLTQELGQPGANNSLSSSLNNMKKSIESLVMRPEVESSRTSVVEAAQILAGDLKRMSDVVQNFRKAADTEIYKNVQDINVLLEDIEGINSEIIQASGMGASTVELADVRDNTLKKLSALIDIDIQMTPRGDVSIFSAGGTLLQGEAHKLTFIQTSGINASVSYAGGNMNGILIDGDPARDLTTFISGGRLGGLLQTRDTEMPAMQKALDELTSVLSFEVNKTHNLGTASSVPQTLTGTRSGLTNGDVIVGAGSVKIAIVERSTGNLMEETTIDLSTIGSLGAINAQINTLGAVASLDANGVLQITANNAAYGIAIAPTTAVATINSGGTDFGFSHYFGLNDFFVNGPVAPGTNNGISSQLSVRSAIVADVSRIANTTLDVTGAVGARVVTSGGPETLIAMTKLFSATANFAAAGKIPGLQTSMNEYTAAIIQFTTDTGRHFEQSYQGELTNYSFSEKTLENIRGVSTQEEIVNLMKWQRQQKVCTELIITAQEMLDDLLRIKR